MDRTDVPHLFFLIECPEKRRFSLIVFEGLGAWAQPGPLKRRLWARPMGLGPWALAHGPWLMGLGPWALPMGPFWVPYFFQIILGFIFRLVSSRFGLFQASFQLQANG